MAARQRVIYTMTQKERKQVTKKDTKKATKPGSNNAMMRETRTARYMGSGQTGGVESRKQENKAENK